MTLPEIPKEENEQPKTKCQFCGVEGKSKSHERFCSKNPNNPRTKKKVAMKQEPLLEAPIILPPETPAEPLIISDVQPYIGNDVAWFDGPDGKFFVGPDYIGIVNNIPMVLVQFHDGAIIPPSMIPGFIGMFKEDAEFDSKKDDDEPFPPFPEEVEEKQSEIKEVKHENVEIIDNIKDDKKEQKKVTKSWWPFSHKKTARPKTPEADKTELTGLIGDAINATG